LAQPHPENPDLIACMMSILPTFLSSEESKDGFIEIVEDEKPDE